MAFMAFQNVAKEELSLGGGFKMAKAPKKKQAARFDPFYLARKKPKMPVFPPIYTYGSEVKK